MEKLTVLVVDDDREIVESIAIFLQADGYLVRKAYNGLEALDIVMTENVHLIILDIMMPELDGIKTLLKVRESKNLPIILLSAKSEDADKILGLTAGADDYITKPFNPSELVARVDAIHRRVTMSKDREEDSEVLSSGPFVLNLKSRSLKKSGRDIDLTQVEFQIMEFFLRNPEVALERQEILNKVWGENYFGDIKIVDVNIRRLRMKIEDQPSDPKHLVTVWGLGYKWLP